jgi:hypothetical protein
MAKLTLDWDDEPLVGSSLLIRTDWEPYRLAFWINEWMHTGLVFHAPLAQTRPTGMGTYPLFRHEGNEVDPYWWLVSNKPDTWKSTSPTGQGQLFDAEPEPDRLLSKSTEWDFALLVRADHHNELLTRANQRLVANPAIFATRLAVDKDNQYLLGLMPD